MAPTHPNHSGFADVGGLSQSSQFRVGFRRSVWVACPLLLQIKRHDAVFHKDHAGPGIDPPRVFNGGQQVRQPCLSCFHAGLQTFGGGRYIVDARGPFHVQRQIQGNGEPRATVRMPRHFGPCLGIFRHVVVHIIGVGGGVADVIDPGGYCWHGRCIVPRGFNPVVIKPTGGTNLTQMNRVAQDDQTSIGQRLQGLLLDFGDVIHKSLAHFNGGRRGGQGWNDLVAQISKQLGCAVHVVVRRGHGSNASSQFPPGTIWIDNVGPYEKKQEQKGNEPNDGVQKTKGDNATMAASNRRVGTGTHYVQLVGFDFVALGFMHDVFSLFE